MKPSTGVKRARTDGSPDRLKLAPSVAETTKTSSAATSSSSFRNVSACNRCRLRKNHCDQNRRKAGVKCVGFDPITKREIPRIYVYYLETRLSYLECLLRDNAVPFAPSQDFDIGTTASPADTYGQSPPNWSDSIGSRAMDKATAGFDAFNTMPGTRHPAHGEANKLDSLVSSVSTSSIHGAPDPRYSGSTSGISFARFAVHISRGRPADAFRQGCLRFNQELSPAWVTWERDPKGSQICSIHKPRCYHA